MKKRSRFRFNINSLFKWLYPGMKIKRWIMVSLFGVFMTIAGSALFSSEIVQVLRTVGLATVFCGVFLTILGIVKLIKSFVMAFIPRKEKDIVDILYQKVHLARGPKIVTVGGGTGLAMILHGLKSYTNNISAVVTVADSGGSSGRLREQFDVLPPGDIRNCLVALADAEPLMQKLFQLRFDKGGELQGHNFGNLFITAMTEVTGDFELAVKESSKVLAIRGQVIPSTLEKVSLVAEYEDGSIVEGEDRIPKKNLPIKRVFLKPAAPAATEEALKAIKEADIVILGPGSLYTSIIPNLLVKGVTETIVNSSAVKVYVCNVMTQPGETDGYTASRHAETIIAHSHLTIMDYCVVNTARASDELLARYKEEDAFPVVADTDKIRKLGYKVIEERVINLADFVRHDSARLAKTIVDLATRNKNAKKK
ncbi:uridine diphosphate-N-acetylglucosamine-binding protein YvcK [Candidatus Omnitrophota bacterium]